MNAGRWAEGSGYQGRAHLEVFKPQVPSDCLDGPPSCSQELTSVYFACLFSEDGFTCSVESFVSTLLSNSQAGKRDGSCASLKEIIVLGSESSVENLLVPAWRSTPGM